jgi:cytochrome c553
MKLQNLRIAIIGLTVLCRMSGPAAVPAQAQDGAALFKTWCSTCHEADPESRAPSRDILQRMSPEQILQALEKGAMVAQGAERSRAERRVLAEYLSEKRFGSEPISPIPQSAFCGGSPLHSLVL